MLSTNQVVHFWSIAVHLLLRAVLFACSNRPGRVGMVVGLLGGPPSAPAVDEEESAETKADKGGLSHLLLLPPVQRG